MKALWVTVNLWDGASDKEGASGVWAVTLARDLPEHIAVGAALDTFHEHVGLEELDDYDIETIEPHTKRMLFETEDYKQAYRGQHEIERIANSLEELC